MGAPHSILSENAKSKMSKVVQEILQKYNIKELKTEPMHANQNPTEQRVQEVKKMVVFVMDSNVSAPECL